MFGSIHFSSDDDVVYDADVHSWYDNWYLSTSYTLCYLISILRIEWCTHWTKFSVASFSGTWLI